MPSPVRGQVIGKPVEANAEALARLVTREIGKPIGELCGRHLQTPCLELGGKNPVVVTEEADRDFRLG
ncbi:MAG: aldehyde dehydrogenase family protein [Umezawaea sp.]